MKKVLITGGARGLGRAIAIKFAKNGYDIVITYLKSENDALELAKQIENECNVRCETYNVDFTNSSMMDEFLNSVVDIDVLINNAAYNNDMAWNLKTEEEFLKTLKVNLVAPFLLSQKMYPILEKNGGSIVNIASTNGIDSMYSESLDYDASKAGLINLTKNLASAFGPKVRVNAVAPGWIDTHNTCDMNPSFKESEQDKIVMGRFATVEEIADVVYFVANDASYMTGSIIRVDGGIKYGNR